MVNNCESRYKWYVLGLAALTYTCAMAMPRMCRLLRATPELDSISIVILSGIAAESNLDFAKFGANACIAKGPLKAMAENIVSVLDEVAPNSYFPVSKEVIGSDTIHQREIIKELLSSRSHFEAVLNHMSEGILEVTVDERIVYANPTASLLTAVSEEKLLACHLNEIFVEPSYAVIRGLMGRAKSDSTSILTSLAVPLKGRQIIPLVLPVLDEAGQSFILCLHHIFDCSHHVFIMSCCCPIHDLAQFSNCIHEIWS